MYPDDHDFQFYNNENDGYRGGFGDYTDGPGYQQPPQQPQQPEKPRRFAKRTMALVLACVVAGGAAGVGSAAVYSHVHTEPAVIFESTRAPAEVLANQNPGQPMTPQQLYAANLPSCVGITVSTTGINIFGQPTTSAASGSGFVLSPDGYILTNFHVIREAALDNTVDIEVNFADGQKYKAQLVGGEEGNDVAILKIEAEGLQPVTLGDSDKMVVGEAVYAIGNPLGELTYTFTDGMVSALDRLISTSADVTLNMLQTNCAINPGNSGGPLFNEFGEVIGINTAKYGASSSGASVEGLGFAIPINDVKVIVSDLIQYGYVTGKPYMGIQMESVPANAQQYGVSAGAHILAVAPDSAAEKAGLKTGDIVVAVGDTVVDSSPALSAAVSTYRAGDSAKLSIIRNNEKMELTIVFDEKNDETVAANQPPQQPQPQPQQPQPQPQIPPEAFQFPWPFSEFFF